MPDFRNKEGQPLSMDSGTYEGTTTASYATALEWSTADIQEKTILLKNEHASTTIYFKLLGYMSEDGNAQEIVAETSLAGATTAEFRYKRFWYKLVLQVKNNSGSADYQVDWSGIPV